MPITDTDTLKVLRATRSGETTFDLLAEWRDANDVLMGTLGVSFPSYAEMVSFCSQQNENDLWRALLTPCINRNTGNFKTAVYDGLSGKTWEINQRVKDVTPP